jgi:hypothetical protein
MIDNRGEFLVEFILVESVFKPILGARKGGKPTSVESG